MFDTKLPLPLTAAHGFYPILPLREVIVFPQATLPLFVGRKKSIHAVQHALRHQERLVCIAQRQAEIEDPSEEDLYSFGVCATIIQVLTLRDGTLRVLVQGINRFKVQRYVPHDSMLFAKGDSVLDRMPEGKSEKEIEGLRRAALYEFESLIKASKKNSEDFLDYLQGLDNLGMLADALATHLPLLTHQKQEIIEDLDVTTRLERVLRHMQQEIELLQAERQIRNRVKSQIEKNQRQYYLNEQLKAIQKELGDEEDGKDDFSLLEERIATTKLSPEAKDKATAELKKLKMMSPMSAEATVSRTYLDWLLSIPWEGKKKKMRLQLDKAKTILDEDHFGSEKVKERILEHLAVLSRLHKAKGETLCLVGPPGVGKTTFAKSVARATGRPFVRIALGGISDESEIRGHRRTYVGSMPGKIIQAMRKAGHKNPVMLLDELDKLGFGSWRGDPQAALLEILDAEQNKSYMDHYLDVEYDLSDVLFIATANTLNLMPPLLDRLDIVRLSGYTEEEKMQIAKRHLVPRQLEKHGLRAGEFSLTEEAILQLIRLYSREAGVRQLEREIAQLCRKTLKKIVSHELSSVAISAENLKDFAGIARYRYGEIEKEDLVGITTGLAWTEVGGELLSIEAVMWPGKGKIISTGKLGEVMQESIQAASSFIRSRAEYFGIDPAIFGKRDIHVHVPEGAIPKDGPSAGIAMCTSIISLLTGIPVRRDVGMTGEISLKGRVFAIGGLKEKLFAAYRGGIKKVLIPEYNIKDLEEVPEVIKENMAIVPVETLDQVMQHALVAPIVPFIGPSEHKSFEPSFS